MTAYINGEILIFLWSLLSGMTIMLLYDFFASFTASKNQSILVCNIFDGIFVICAVFLMMFILLNVSNGYIRSFEFVGVAIGGILYKILLSRLFKTLFSWLIHIFFTIFNFFYKILLTPIRFMYKIMHSIMCIFCGLVSRWVSPLRYQLRTLKICLKKELQNGDCDGKFSKGCKKS